MIKNGFAEGRGGYRNGGGFTGLGLVKRIVGSRRVVIKLGS